MNTFVAITQLLQLMTSCIKTIQTNALTIWLAQISTYRIKIKKKSVNTIMDVPVA